jgi:hypothetical protein
MPTCGIYTIPRKSTPVPNADVVTINPPSTSYLERLGRNSTRRDTHDFRAYDTSTTVSEEMTKVNQDSLRETEAIIDSLTQFEDRTLTMGKRVQRDKERNHTDKK